MPPLTIKADLETLVDFNRVTTVDSDEFHMYADPRITTYRDLISPVMRAFEQRGMSGYFSGLDTRGRLAQPLIAMQGKEEAVQQIVSERVKQLNSNWFIYQDGPAYQLTEIIPVTQGGTLLVFRGEWQPQQFTVVLTPETVVDALEEQHRQAPHHKL